MPYTPQLGVGATLTLGGVGMDVIDMRCQLQRESVDVTTVADLHTTFVAGRISGRITATLAVDSLIVSAVMNGFRNQTAFGSPVAVVYSDSGMNTYTCSALILSAEHTISGAERDTLAIELQTTGQIT